MSWHKIDDHPSKGGHFIGNTKYGKEVSRQTIALTTWRCGGCRALAVTSGNAPDCKCSKYGAPP